MTHSGTSVGTGLIEFEPETLDKMFGAGNPTGPRDNHFSTMSPAALPASAPVCSVVSLAAW